MERGQEICSFISVSRNRKRETQSIHEPKIPLLATGN